MWGKRCAVPWGSLLAFCENGERHDSCEGENIDTVVAQEFLDNSDFLNQKM